jgi:hypothetical protein
MDKLGPEAKFWSSYNHYDGLGATEGGYCFMISIVLDAGAWRLFSAIRVALIYQETAKLQNVASTCQNPLTTCYFC